MKTTSKLEMAKPTVKNKTIDIVDFVITESPDTSKANLDRYRIDEITLPAEGEVRRRFVASVQNEREAAIILGALRKDAREAK
jgi:hypothetical protein